MLLDPSANKLALMADNVPMAEIMITKGYPGASKAFWRIFEETYLQHENIGLPRMVSIRIALDTVEKIGFLNITGRRLYWLWKCVCKKNAKNVLAVLEALNEGLITIDQVDLAIDRKDASILNARQLRQRLEKTRKDLEKQKSRKITWGELSIEEIMKIAYQDFPT